jgi:hypothetical protein
MSGHDRDYESGRSGSSFPHTGGYLPHTRDYSVFAGYRLGGALNASSPERLGGWALLGTMAAHAFVFVILASIGGALLATASLSLPRVITVGAQMLGAGLQIFAAVWFIALVVIAWRRFIQTDWDIASPTQAVEAGR